MKKLIIIIVLTLSNFFSFSQELVQEFKKLTLENDSLKRQVNWLLTDSVFKLNNTINKLDVEVINCKKALKKDSVIISSLQLRIEGMNQSKLKRDRDSLKLIVDSLLLRISKLESTI